MKTIMKLLSIAIPCYNSAAYMGKCIESLLKGGEDVEILIVDDEKNIVDIIAFNLKKEGYQVITAADGEEGVKRRWRKIPTSSCWTS